MCRARRRYCSSAVGGKSSYLFEALLDDGRRLEWREPRPVRPVVGLGLRIGLSDRVDRPREPSADSPRGAEQGAIPSPQGSHRCRIHVGHSFQNGLLLWLPRAFDWAIVVIRGLLISPELAGKPDERNEAVLGPNLSDCLAGFLE
jgi:hypothetical protein